MIQVKNNSSSKKVSINWSNGAQALLDVAGQAGCVSNVPEGILETEVDSKIAAFPFIDKLCGSILSEADLEVQYAATEGNDALFTLTPATISNEDLANSANAHTREVVLLVVLEYLLLTTKLLLPFQILVLRVIFLLMKVMKTLQQVTQLKLVLSSLEKGMVKFF